MKAVDIENVIAVLDENDANQIRFATRDGEQAFLVDAYQWTTSEELEEGDIFVILDEDDELYGGLGYDGNRVCIYLHGNEHDWLHATPVTSEFWGRSENEMYWRADVNNDLETSNLRLGDYHDMPVVIEGDIYDNGYYDMFYFKDRGWASW